MLQHLIYGGNRHYSITAAIGVIALTSVGCGPKRPNIAPVKGHVLFDGQPLTTGSLATMPKAGRGAKGVINSDGTFELSTFGKGDGATIGRHKVAVAAFESSAKAGPESGNGKLLVPERYTNPESSGLTIDVQPGGNYDVVLELTSKEDKK